MPYFDGMSKEFSGPYPLAFADNGDLHITNQFPVLGIQWYGAQDVAIAIQISELPVGQPSKDHQVSRTTVPGQLSSSRIVGVGDIFIRVHIGDVTIAIKVCPAPDGVIRSQKKRVKSDTGRITTGGSDFSGQ